MPTRRGLYFLAAGLAVLALGIMRMELAALFWGATTTALAIYSLPGVLLSAYFLKKQTSSPAFSSGLKFFPDYIYPGSRVTARLEIFIPGRIIPGIGIVFVYRVISQDGRVFHWRKELRQGQNIVFLDIQTPGRGKYSGPPGILSVEDVFGFALREIPLPGTEEITVFPDILDDIPALHNEVTGGEAPVVDRERIRTNEFLEVRKYIPGDDIRRLDWKLFAHANELMLRIGEEESPPESLTFLFLDTTICPGAASHEMLTHLADRMASLSAGVAMHLPGNGRRLLISTPDHPSPLVVEPGKPEVILELLARLRYRVNCRESHKNTPKDNTPGNAGDGGLGRERNSPVTRLINLLEWRKPSRLIIYFFPGALWADEMKKIATDRNIGIQIFLIDSGQAPPESKFSPFFLPSPQKRKALFHRRDWQNLRKLLETEGRRISDAEIL